MKQNTKKWLRLVLLALFCVSTALLLRQFLDNAGGSNAYADALQIAQKTEKALAASQPRDAVLSEAPQGPRWVPAPVENDPNMQTLETMDLEALRQVNGDVIGWIWIPDSNIHYPLMQGPDNDYYLKRTWEGKENSVGSIFLEWRNDPALTDYNTIIYGHNMNDGSMFANLKRYSAQWYFDRHPYVYIATDAGVFRYEVFSSYEAGIDSITYGLSFQQEKTKADFLIHALEKSRYDTGIVPQPNDRILTLSTCSGMGHDNRWVVHARLKMVEITE